MVRKLGVTATVVLALVLAGCTASASPTAPTTAKTAAATVPTTISPPGGDRTTTTTLPSTAVACTASQLTVGGFGSSGAAGTGVSTIRIENTSSSPCALRGYPVVTFLGNASSRFDPAAYPAHVLLVAVGQTSLFGNVSKVVLTPGKAASAGFIITNDDNEGGTTCPTATSIRVRLPDVAGSFSVDVAVQVIGILLCNPPSAADISPIVKGAVLAVSPEFTVPTTTLPTVVIRYEPGPVVPVPPTPCADGELRAADYSNGPFTTMGTKQDIITVTSSAPCRLDGYPTLQFGTASNPIVVTVEHNGAVGHQASPRPVAVGTGTPASFLVQTVMGVAATTMHCTGTKVMSIGIPGTTPSLSVSLPAGSFGPAWYPCGVVRVTPFEQGDTLDQYA
jgi:hypothetical protein